MWWTDVESRCLRSGWRCCHYWQGVVSAASVPFGTSQRVSLLFSSESSLKASRWNLLTRGAINMLSSHPEVPLKTPAGILLPPPSLIAIYVLIAEAKVTTWPNTVPDK